MHLALVFILAGVLGVGWLASGARYAATESEASQAQALEVIEELGEILSSLKDAENGQRGFMITGNEDYLAPYQLSRDTLASRLADLARLSELSPSEQQRLATLTPLVAAKLAQIEETIALRHKPGFPVSSQTVLLQSGRETMDKIAALVAQAQDEHKQLLKDRITTRQTHYLGAAPPVLLGGTLGAFTLLLCIYLKHDLSSRRRAEADRQARQEQLRLATDAAQLGICMWQPDGGRITWVNECACDILGIPRSAAPATTPCFAQLVHPEDLPALEQALTNTVQIGTRLLYQGRLRRPDGTLRWVEFTGQPVQPLQEELSLHVVGTVCDITVRKQAEQALRESQRFFRSSLDAFSGHIAVLDESGTILEINEAWQRFADENQPAAAAPAMKLGIGVNYLQHCAQTLKQGEIPDYARGIMDVIAGRRTHFEMEYACHSPTRQRWFAMRVSRFQTPGPVRIIIVHDDCTERKLAEDARRKSQERYRKLFNLMDKGFCIVEMIFDEHRQPVDCRFLETNPAFEKQTGMHGMTGKRLREIAPASEAQWLKIGGKVALTGEPVRLAYEEKVPHRRWFDIYATRLEESDNPEVAIVFNNITDRKRAEEALRQSEQRFRAIFDLGPVAMYSCDPSGRILEFNPCAVRLWGREPRRDNADERFCGPAKIYRPDGTPLLPAQNPMIAVLKGDIPQAHDVEAIMERPDGSRITVIANIVPLKNDRQEITGAINCFYDITERSRLERKTKEQAQALADLHHRKDEFLAMLSHELRNPLAPLANAVQLLGLQKDQDPVQRQARSIIERQVGQLKHLVDDLLDISRITSGTVRLRPERISVGSIVERALETARPLVALRRHELTLSQPAQALWLHADATRLEQVLVNLLANAAKYTDEGGHIWLSVEQEGDAACGAVAVLRVRDNGLGIEPELLPHIFELFSQAERSLDRSQGGLGIGLCLVQQLVELHQGSVKAYSVFGQGSEFVVRLPLMPTPAPLPPSAAPPPEQPQGKGCRVLAVDDNVDVVQSLAMLLELSGHEVRTAYDGPSAIEAALAMRPDVVLMDIGLPGLTGYEVAQRMRQEDALKGVMLVALTGYGREADRQRSRTAGFDHHLVKPADFRQIEQIVASVAQRVA